MPWIDFAFITDPVSFRVYSECQIWKCIILCNYDIGLSLCDVCDNLVLLTLFIPYLFLDNLFTPVLTYMQGDAHFVHHSAHIAYIYIDHHIVLSLSPSKDLNNGYYCFNIYVMYLLLVMIYLINFLKECLKIIIWLYAVPL